MEQQLLQNLVDITPDTMDELLGKIQALLASNSVQDQKILSNIVKSLFYGLWNFDKMINQHNLSTKISQLLLKIPKKNALLFFKQIIVFLEQKWNLIDHHRINKFMQLVRYLIFNCFKMCEKHNMKKKKIDQILLEKVYTKKQQSGMAQHIADIYFQICEQTIHPHGATLDQLWMFQHLLLTHQSQNLRIYICEHIYEKYKRKLAKKYQNQTQTQLNKLQQQIQQFSQRFFQLAKKQQKDLHRKNLYTLIGFAKSPQFSFIQYLSQKKQKARAQQQKKKKKLTKFKKQEIKVLKAKRKEKKGKKISKIMSLRKFQDKTRMKKVIQQQ